MIHPAAGAAQKNLLLGDIRRFRIKKPSLDDQERLVATISVYDDLIENNRRRLALLEEAARLLYREWFVYFRFPGHEHVQVIDGLPLEWISRQIAGMTTHLGRGIPPAYDDDATYWVVNQKCIRNRMLSMEQARRQKREYKAGKALQLHDVLINSTGTGTLGRVSQCWSEPTNTTFDSHVTVARPNDTVDPYWFGYAMLSLESLFGGMGEGATNQKELGRGRIAATKPPHALQREFEEFTSETSRQIRVLSDRIVKLEEARDLLLPRLMNGEIAV